MLRPLMEAARDTGIYARLDELAGARADDPRVAGLAAELAEHLPDEMAALMVAHGSGWLEEMSGAQREVFRVLVQMLKDRAC